MKTIISSVLAASLALVAVNGFAKEVDPVNNVDTKTMSGGKMHHSKPSSSSESKGSHDNMPGAQQ